MRKLATYSIDDLESETGIERRTISYYVQEGLLPRVGRRGPKTRYPKTIRDRLLFVQKLRELEDRGRIPNLTLAQIRDIFEHLSEAQIARVADGKEPLDALVLGTAGDPREMRDLRDFDLTGDAVQMSLDVPRLEGEEDAPDVASLEQATGVRAESPSHDMFTRERDVAYEPAAPRSASQRREGHRRLRQQQRAARILELLQDVQDHAQAERHESTSEYISEPWTRVQLTSDLVLSVRGRDRRLDQVLDRLAREIRGALGRK